MRLALALIALLIAFRYWRREEKPLPLVEDDVDWLGEFAA